MNRRNFLVIAAAGVPLAACSAAQIAKVETVSGQVVNDVNIIANGVAAVLPGLSAIGAVGAGVSNAVGSLVNDAKQAASAVTTAITTVAAQPFVAQVGSDITATVTALKGIALPTSISGVLQAAQSLLPVVQTAVGLLASVPLAGGMDPNAARAILAAAAARGA